MEKEASANLVDMQLPEPFNKEKDVALFNPMPCLVLFVCLVQLYLPGINPEELCMHTMCFVQFHIF